jgi:hypothetical protein
VLRALSAMGWQETLLRGLCRWSYYISLLGLKIPLGLLVKASRAPHVLAFITLVWVPFLVYCHVALLSSVQTATVWGPYIWHILLALWVTIPLHVVGVVILSVARSRGLLRIFLLALMGVACLHWLVVPRVCSTRVGTVLLQTLFLAFEDLPVLGWIWCLYHVVRMQRHVAIRQAARESPITAPQGTEDKVLIVGNAPTVTEGEPLGPVIDSFHNVIRFNQYSVDKPDFTGSKVSFHFCNGRNFPTSKSVTAVCPLFFASLTHAVYLFMPHMEDARDIYAGLASAKVDSWFMEEEQILALRKKIGLMIWQIPTSGMVAVDGFLQKRKQVVLHGFNFFQGKKIHYFEESATQLLTSWLERFVTHQPSAEKRWVAALQREGRVTFLRDSYAAAVAANEEEVSAEVLAAAAEKERKLSDNDAEPRRRPGLLKTLLKDGLPSQFSL